MSPVFAIARHEARRIFVSPLAWTVLAVIQFIYGFLYTLTVNDMVSNPGSLNQYMGVSDYIGGGLFGTSVIILMLVIPLMTMRLFAEDKKSGSLVLLTSAPASLVEIVLGKFLGLSVFFAVMIALLALMAFSLLLGTDLDTGRLLAGLLGQFLLMASFGAAGLCMSTLTREPVIAAVAGFGLLLVVLLLDAMAYGSGPLSELFRHLSLIGHFEKLRRGVFDTADVAYYLLFITFFLWLAVQRLDLERS